MGDAPAAAELELERLLHWVRLCVASAVPAEGFASATFPGLARHRHWRTVASSPQTYGRPFKFARDSGAGQVDTQPFDIHWRIKSGPLYELLETGIKNILLVLYN